MGNLRDRERLLTELARLPELTAALDEEVLYFVGQNRLSGRGIGYVDAHLLAAVRLRGGVQLWTYDKRLHDVATDMGVAFPMTSSGRIDKDEAC